MPRLEPATRALADDGTPISPRYGDVYHSADSGPGQAHHVFLGGNGLPERWRGRASFTILETGFGLGVNFLATWQAWRADPARSRRLHYVAIEKHPFLRDDLAALLAAYPGFAELADELAGRWPPALPGTHRRAFDDGRLVLTLVLDDVESALRRLDAVADAIYLDGFAPARNPAMWSPQVLRGVARHALPGATCATWSTARAVRDALADAGFALETRPGFGHKREMLAGRRLPRGTPRGPTTPSPPDGERHAIVVGAGLAGASAAWQLARRRWRVTLVDAAAGPATGASSLHAGSFHPLVARDDSLLARLSRAAFLHALDAWRELERRGHAIAWSRCGVLQLARRHGGDAALRATIDELGFPASFVEFVDADTGSARAGLRVDRAGAWFPEGGWARASSIVRAQLDEVSSRHDARFLASRRVASLARTADGWRVMDASGECIADAPVAVLANATDLARLSPIGTPVRSVRGQVSHVPAAALAPPRAVVIGHGYVLPAIGGIVVAGSSYDVESTQAEPTPASHEGNLARLRALSPEIVIDAEAAALGGGVGFRAVVADRLPIVGALPDLEQPGGSVDRVALRDGLFAIGAFASRGLVWSSLAGEILAARIDGDPLPVETDLAAAIDPARFVRRARRRAAG
ncbi:tRNA 5-methylaminomethyl-2-thiouridine biosynthesis bifunctional protein MnmC [Burkholderiales bacterium]|nr:tRNA 5-methylaminomethyl-2-thiouridine biosynthesis bifunctional protein MnmC [Burkholderiales bacterium]